MRELLLCLFTILPIFAPSAPPVFNDREKAEIVQFWNAPGRYTHSLPFEAAKMGVFQVRLSTKGSAWLLKYW